MIKKNDFINNVFNYRNILKYTFEIVYLKVFEEDIKLLNGWNFRIEPSDYELNL